MGASSVLWFTLHNMCWHLSTALELSFVVPHGNGSHVARWWLFITCECSMWAEAQACAGSQILLSMVPEKHPLPEHSGWLDQTGAVRVLGRGMKHLTFCSSVAEGFPKPQLASLSFLTWEGFFYSLISQIPKKVLAFIVSHGSAAQLNHTSCEKVPLLVCSWA